MLDCPPFSMVSKTSVFRNSPRFFFSGSVDIVDGRVGKLLNLLLKPLEFVQRHITFSLFDGIHSASSDVPGSHACTLRLFRNKLSSKSEFTVSPVRAFSVTRINGQGNAGFERTLLNSSRVSFVGRGMGTVILPLDSCEGFKFKPAFRMAFSTDKVSAPSNTFTKRDRGSRTETCATFCSVAIAP
jgi:hypothetical protein